MSDYHLAPPLLFLPPFFALDLAPVQLSSGREGAFRTRVPTVAINSLSTNGVVAFLAFFVGGFLVGAAGSTSTGGVWIFEGDLRLSRGGIVVSGVVGGNSDSKDGGVDTCAGSLPRNGFTNGLERMPITGWELLFLFDTMRVGLDGKPMCGITPSFVGTV